jgi:predicted nuclease with TOPRIM domain
MEEKTGGANVFVKIDEYKDILDILELIKNKLNEAKETLGNLNELKNEEDSELELWNSTLSEIERKVENIDRSLLEPEGAW